MRLISFLSVLLGLLLSLYLVSASASQLGSGLQNNHNTCYMNSLLSCLFDVTPFRKAIYDNYNDNVIIRAIANVFGMKQLNLFPDVALEPNLMATISNQAPHWEFGGFQDIDEFMKLIFQFFPPTVTNVIGYEARERMVTIDGSYVVNEGLPIRIPMVTVHLPERPSAESLNFQALVNIALSGVETRDYTIHREEHPLYFEMHQISPFTFEIPAQVSVQQRVSQYADVVPVFVARRTQLSGTTKRHFRQDPFHGIEMLTFPLDNGESAQFTLTAFAVYVPGHYYAYTKSFPSKQWLLYNDSSVSEADVSRLVADLHTKAVMMFYVKKGSSVETVVPEAVQNWAMTDMVLRHMEEETLRRTKKMVKKFKKSS